MITLLLILCLIMAIVPFIGSSARAISTSAVAVSTLVFAMGVYAAWPTLLGSSVVLSGGLWYLDSLSSLMVLLISFVQWTATISSMSYLKEEVEENAVSVPMLRRYFALLGLFVLSMLATVVSNNLGFMWVALEATTLATAFLVAFYARQGSLEAAWKYLILCSTGISLGLMGLLCVYYAASAVDVVEGLKAIEWTHLFSIAPTLSPDLLRVAFAFILIGYGTKVGLVPMHAWLPDAHSRAPSPISGILSGVLLNAALFAILRYKALVDGSMGSNVWTNDLLLWFGVLSVLVPAAFILLQTDYKRLLAYSSIEHMGLMAFSIGLGGVGVIAGAIHMIGHALIKSMLFFDAGNILLRFKSTKFERVGDVMRIMPYSGAFFLIGILALLAVPPSPLFLSEYLIISTGIVDHPIAMVLVLVALTIILAGFVRLFMPMLFSREYLKGNAIEPEEVGEHWGISHTAFLLHVVLILAVGVSLWTAPGKELLQHLAAVIT
ncbi:hydrogenase 4 subunit F [Candidatus Kaiserbacteria bacterium]|nr:hydrogenase 4 subunit F [Candidatus Kaiserbacteria bacterium]